MESIPVEEMMPMRWAVPLLLTLLALVLLPWLLAQLRLVWRLTRDRRVPFLLRLLAPLAVIYALSPIDLMPGRWRVFGWADDLLVLLLAGWLLVKLAPQRVVREHQGLAPEDGDSSRKSPGKVVEGRGRVVR
jgi:uncharacterized membrane protein YkvA (DUF1232 family)